MLTNIQKYSSVQNMLRRWRRLIGWVAPLFLIAIIIIIYDSCLKNEFRPGAWTDVFCFVLIIETMCSRREGRKTARYRASFLASKIDTSYNLVCFVRTVSCGPSFFSSPYDPSAKRAGHKRGKTNEDP